jgi:UDP-N-acetylglucosamine acyltransferase
MIHPTAIVYPGAKIGSEVEIGPYSIIGEHVEIGDGSKVGPHVVVEGITRIGKRNRFYQFSSIGCVPQDKKYSGEPTRLEIGDDNTFHEYCTISTGTAQDSSVTRIGDDNWLMAYVHIAHDCQVGSHTIFANNASLAGHAHVGDWVILGGFTGVHQFVRVGAHSFTAGCTLLLQDLPPYVTAAGNPAAPHGINSEGLRRRGFSAESIAAVKQAYRALYRSGLSLSDAREKIDALAAQHAEIQPLADFIGVSGRGLVR